MVELGSRLTCTGLDQLSPSADRDSQTGSIAPGPLPSHTVYISPVTGSPEVAGRQQRIPAGPPPMFLATSDSLLHAAPPSCQVRAPSQTPLPPPAHPRTPPSPPALL